MTRPILLAFVVASLSWPLDASAQLTLLVLDSQPGDYIGGGIKQTFNIADGEFTARRNDDNGVSVWFHTPHYEHWWHLDFAAPGAVLLTPGVYDGATRFPFQEPTEPGLAVGGDGSGCNQLTGRFEVHELTYGPSDTVLSFAAEFEQHCEGITPALFGAIYFNAGAVVPPTMTLTLTGCTTCKAGYYFAVQGQFTNPGTRDILVEFKFGVRTPDGSALSLFEQGEHFVVTLPAGFDGTFPLINVQLPAGLPTGVWRVEGTLLEVALGRTFHRAVKLFEIEP